MVNVCLTLQAKVLEWTPKSPDLNIIEKVWGVMASELGERGNLRCLISDQVWARAANKWNELRSRPRFFSNLAALMPRRLRSHRHGMCHHRLLKTLECGRSVQYCSIFNIKAEAEWENPNIKKCAKGVVVLSNFTGFGGAWNV